jgi:hypothetical protein
MRQAMLRLGDAMLLLHADARPDATVMPRPAGHAERRPGRRARYPVIRRHV